MLNLEEVLAEKNLKKEYRYIYNYKSLVMIKQISNKLILLIFCAAIFVSCKKNNSSNSGTGTIVEQLFESEILNHDFIVNLAIDNGVNYTSNYNGYTFRLLKTDYYNGPFTAKKGTTTYTGTWSSNTDYSKLTITLPTTPSEFVFLTREWRFISKNLPQLKLSPWGSSAPIELDILRQ